MPSSRAARFTGSRPRTQLSRIVSQTSNVTNLLVLLPAAGNYRLVRLEAPAFGGGGQIATAVSSSRRALRETAESAMNARLAILRIVAPGYIHHRRKRNNLYTAVFRSSIADAVVTLKTRKTRIVLLFFGQEEAVMLLSRTMLLNKILRSLVST